MRFKYPDRLFLSAIALLALLLASPLQGCTVAPSDSGNDEPSLVLEQQQDQTQDKSSPDIPAPKRKPINKVAQKESVYFARQSSIIDAKAHHTLEKLAMIMRMDKTLYAHLVGSSDHRIRNPSLALRRAIAVKNVLTQMGVPLSRITVKDGNKTSTILSQQQSESGLDPKDRRVDIIVDALVGQEI